MEMVNCKINGIAVSVPKGSTILEAARAAGVEIPPLCYMKKLNEIGACRISIVEATGARGLVTACVYPVSEGMEVKTNTPKVQAARRTTLELLLSTHDKKCLSCSRSTNCELQKLCREYGVEESRYEGYKPHYELDTSTPHLVRDNNKCILCRRCVAVCREQYVSVIGPNDRGIDTSIGTAFKVNLSEVPCISCGQCAAVCPTGAITEKDDTDKVWEALGDPTKHVVVQTAPSVRATLGECCGMPIGTNVEGKMVSALRRLGFDRVFDTDFAADLTIMEEANELVERIKNKGTLPMITSCSPGWIKFCEYYYPDMLDHLSSCKSPQQMAGAVIKTYYAEKAGIDPKDIVSVSVKPCTAKKFECAREEFMHDGVPETDYVITTQELIQMIHKAGLVFDELEPVAVDPEFSTSTGAGVIFGVTGGVTEAVLRRLSTDKSKKALLSIAFNDVRGMKGVKETTIPYGDKEVRIAIVSGLKNAESVIQALKNGEHFDFIEVMACPGGCVAGGGQPFGTNATKEVRGKALYSADKMLSIKRSEENPLMLSLYDGVLKGRVHELLHVHYNHKEEE